MYVERTIPGRSLRVGSLLACNSEYRLVERFAPHFLPHQRIALCYGGLEVVVADERPVRVLVVEPKVAKS